MNPSVIICLTLLILAHQCIAASLISKADVNSTLQTTKLQAQKVLSSVFVSFSQLSNEISFKAAESLEYANFTIKLLIELQLDDLEDIKKGAQGKNISYCFNVNKERLLDLENEFVLSSQSCLTKVEDDLLFEIVAEFEHILGYVKIIRQLEINLGSCQDLDLKCIQDVADALEEDYPAQMTKDAEIFVERIRSNGSMLCCVETNANNCKESGKIILEDARTCFDQQ